jgi:glycosyltransferase involved in cell wall biosynthesis
MIEAGPSSCAYARSGPIALFFAGTGGGVQSVQVTLAGALAARGFAVSCVLPQAKGPFLRQLPSSVELVDLGTRSPLVLVHRLARFLRRRRPNLLFAAQHHTIVAALLARRLAAYRMPLVAVQHNTLSVVCRNSPYRLTRWFIPTALRILLPQAEMVCAVSEGVARDLASTLGLPPSRVTVLYNPVVQAGMAERAAEPSGHPWLDSREMPVVLGVGSLIERKDFATLIRAFAHLARRRPARLVVLGEGPERPHLEQLIGELDLTDLVALPGFVTNPLSFIAKADALALSSRVEGLPTVIIEALACGTPIVATDCPHGPAELLGDGAYGRLVPIGDAEALGEALSATLSGPCDPERLRQRAADFAVDRAVERYVNVIRTYVAASAAS